MVDYFVVGVDEATTDGSRRAALELLGRLPGLVYSFRMEGLGAAKSTLLAVAAAEVHRSSELQKTFSPSGTLALFEISHLECTHSFYRVSRRG